jgi:predicted lipoprotein with Yx(FWY)xxD motif
MRRLLIAGVTVLAVALAAGIAIAATTGGGGDSKSGKGATVSVKRISGAGKVLVDAKGRALYRNDQERRGRALCTRSCLSFWTPVLAHGIPRGTGISGKLALVKRPDGGRQVTYKGKLLYTFMLDKGGKVTGDNFKDTFDGRTFTWHVVHPTAANNASPPPKTTSTPAYPGY